MALIPASESEKRKWFLSLRENLPKAAAQLNLSATMVQTLSDNLTKAINNIDDVSQKELDLAGSKENRDNHIDFLVPELQNSLGQRNVMLSDSYAIYPRFPNIFNIWRDFGCRGKSKPSILLLYHFS